MRLLDLFCGAGGAAYGYMLAGFHVTGVDINPQPRYRGDRFIQADALEYCAEHGHEFDAIHASPPCQGYSKTRNLHKNAHPMLIEETRNALRAAGKPYIIENVPGAPLLNPTVLVGSMFGLRTMRKRLFETSFELPFMLAPSPAARHARMGRPPQAGEYVHVVGHFSGIEYCRQAMGVTWMSQGELAEAIPPAYTEWFGRLLLEQMEGLS